MIDLTPVFQAAVALIAAVITVFVIPYIKGKTTEQQREQVSNWVRVAVTAAEQLYTGSKKGTEKKAFVLNFLTELGLTVDEAALDALIEAAVHKLKNGALE